MKNLVFVNGTMGVGKSETCKHLKSLLTPSVFLDGDWCWDMEPFTVNDETKGMVIDNISHILGNFLNCTAFDSVIFCWVMHERSIVDSILERINADEEYRFFLFTLTATENALVSRLTKDIEAGKRKSDVIERSLERATHYNNMGSTVVDVSSVSAACAAEHIADAIKKS